MKKIPILLILMFLICATTQAQDSAYVRGLIRTLTSNNMYGRGASYSGDSIAADFLAGEMRRLGVLPLQVNYLQHYTYSCYSHEGPISLSINGNELKPYTQYRICPAARYATPRCLDKATWKRQQKDGTWLIGVKQLDTYGPTVENATWKIKKKDGTWQIGDYSERPNPVCIEILDTLIPKRVKKIELELPLQYRANYRSQNVVGYVQGVVDTMVVFTAHYDHCGTMGDGVIFPGAHDNASGTAAVMDIARIACQQKPYYTMVFMLFSGEESGLKGSKYAAENPLIDFSKVKLLCNLDMFCGGDEGIMVFNANSEQTKPFFLQLQELNEECHAAVEIRPRDNAPNSDHYWFSNYCPSIFLLTMGQPYGGYHDPADTCDACGLGHYNDFIGLIRRLASL